MKKDTRSSPILERESWAWERALHKHMPAGCGTKKSPAVKYYPPVTCGPLYCEISQPQ